MSDVKINWFEVPVADLKRAAGFYEKVLGTKLVPMETPDARMQAFQSNGTPVGALVEGKHNQPSGTGSLLYFDAGGDIDGVLGRVQKAGGKVVLPRTSIGPHGHIAQFVDPEGNRIALHAT